MQRVGEWTAAEGLVISDKYAFTEGRPPNITLKVLSRIEEPFVMFRKIAPGDPTPTGNARFEGFCVDLLEQIANQVGFNYNIELVEDNNYGAFNLTTKVWNGLVRELMDHKADIAVGAMTIIFARENVIDFTKPFMNLGISILFKKPEVAPAQLFSFMNPLALEIWIYILLAYILVSLTIWIVARFSPNEWSSPHPCVDS